jgi:hypothetical protein
MEHLRLTRDSMLWGKILYKISAMQRSPGRREFTATPEGSSGSHIVIDQQAMTMTCDGIVFKLENWRVDGGAVECDTVDPATDDTWVRDFVADLDAGLRGG